MLTNRLSSLLVVFATAAASIARAQTAERPAGAPLVLAGARVYTDPAGPPLERATVVIRDGRIESVGQLEKGNLPADAQVIDGAGLTVMAGFWNCHVHFYKPEWQEAATKPADQLSAQLRDMLTRYGFTSVFDLGSFVENTLALRRRIEAGDVDGPRILTTGVPIAAKDGTPVNMRPQRMPEVDTVQEARDAARTLLEQGADALKIYAYSPTGGPQTPVMSVELVRAIVDEAHRAGKLAFAHPEHLSGIQNIVAGGVDVVAHATEEGGPWPAELVQSMKRANIALIPTLYLYKLGKMTKGSSESQADAYLKQCHVLDQVRAYSRAGGTILFGTDVGFYPQNDMSEEFTLLKRAGLDLPQILTALTTAPAERLGLADRCGRVSPGFDADLVVLAGDPRRDILALSRVKYTLRGGRIIYAAE